MRFLLNPESGQPLYLQMVEQVRYESAMGELAVGERMPGMRALAAELGVGHNTVVRAYAELEREGLLEVRHGLGAFVAEGAQPTREGQMRDCRREMRKAVELLHVCGIGKGVGRRLFEAVLLEVFGE